MGHRPNMSGFPMPRQVWHQSRMCSPTKRCYCWRMTPRQGSQPPEQVQLKLGDSVAVFVQGSAGLCAILAAHLLGATDVIAVDDDPDRLDLAKQYGATETLLARDDPAGRIRTITENRGVDGACVDFTNDDANVQETFESAMRALRPGGTLSSVGVHGGQLKVSPDVYGAACAAVPGAGRNDQAIVPTLRPGGKERMARLMRLARRRRVDLSPLITHLFTLEEIVEAYNLVGSHRSGVLKVGIRVA